jgi:hypothetical protein
MFPPMIDAIGMPKIYGNTAVAARARDRTALCRVEFAKMALLAPKPSNTHKILWPRVFKVRIYEAGAIPNPILTRRANCASALASGDELALASFRRRRRRRRRSG